MHEKNSSSRHVTKMGGCLRGGEVLPLVTTFYSNYDNTNIVRQANLLLDSCTNNRIKEVFENLKLLPRTNSPLIYLKSYHKPNSFHVRKLDPKTVHSKVKINYVNYAHYISGNASLSLR